jgi:polyisoprenoid-binding protein YceI
LLVTLVLILSACSGGAGQATEASAPPVIVTASLLPTATNPPAASAYPAVTSDPATAAATATAAYPAADPPATAAPAAGSALTGVVVYAIAPEESTITYEVGETFIMEGNVFKQAVGKTPGVTGEIQVDFDQPQNTTIGALSANITGFTSDSGRRDGAIRDRFLESAKYPTVTFTPTSIEGLPAAFEPGVDYPITISGDVTIRETTKPAVFQAIVRLEDGAISGQANTTFLMSDFGFGPISIMGMLNTEDEVKITVNFVARPQA